MMSESTLLCDGNRTLPWQYDDGGRARAGRRGDAHDCVCRAIAIAARLPYADVYEQLAKGNAKRTRVRCTGRRSARNGIDARAPWFKAYMASLGFSWRACMTIGSGATVSLVADQVPMTGRHVLSLSRHYAALIDGVLHDTFNPQWQTWRVELDGTRRLSHRCVYGIWTLKE